MVAPSRECGDSWRDAARASRYIALPRPEGRALDAPPRVGQCRVSHRRERRTHPTARSAVPPGTGVPTASTLKFFARNVGTGVGRGLGTSGREGLEGVLEMGVHPVPMPKDRHQVLLYGHTQVESVGCVRQGELLLLRRERVALVGLQLVHRQPDVASGPKRASVPRFGTVGDRGLPQLRWRFPRGLSSGGLTLRCLAAY